MTPAAGDLVADRYRLLRPLASGGMGSVWVARHEALEREVALKFIAGVEHTAEEVRRFTVEAQAAASVQGRHLVHIYDFGFDAARPYLVMELLRGESLAEVAARRAPLAPALVLDLLEQLARGLRLVHSAGIVHRDIKPSNLFLVREGSDQVLKLLDFGIAKSERATARTTTTGTLLGSPGYMSPEQARGNPVDARSDLWSVAVVAFELLTGRALFSSSHVGDAIARICSEPIPAPSRYSPRLATFDAFFERALARNVRVRFGSIDELVDAFRDLTKQGAGRGVAAGLSGPSSIAEQPTLAVPSFEPGAPGRECETKSLLTSPETASTGLALPSTSAGRHWGARSALWASLALAAAGGVWALRPSPEVSSPEGLPDAVVESSTHATVPSASAALGGLGSGVDDERSESNVLAEVTAPSTEDAPEVRRAQPSASHSPQWPLAAAKTNSSARARSVQHLAPVTREPRPSASSGKGTGVAVAPPRAELPRPPKAVIAPTKSVQRDPFSGLPVEDDSR